jgi:ATP-binding cassette subfamily B protein
MSRPVQMINSLSGWLGAATTVVAVVAVVVAIAPVLALVLVLGAVPLWWASRATSRALYAFSLEQTEADRRRQYWFLVLSHRTYAAELRAHGLAREIRGRLESVSRQRLGALRRLVERRILVTAGASVLGAAALFGALVLVVASVDSGHLSLSAAGAVAAAAVVLGERLHGLGSGTASLHEHAWYMQDLSAFVDRCARAGAPDEPEEPAVAGCGVDLGAPVGGPATTSAVGAIHGAETPNRLRAIHLDHVSFQYPSGRDAALDDVSLTIAAGTVVALVGENGSGKTTLAKLVAGLYDPTAGSIRFETAAGNTTAASVRRRNSAFVPQDFGRFWATAGDNIAFGDVDRLGDPTTVELAARHVGAHETIAGLPLGYATMLGTEFHGGTDLSQGQWQRLALARAAFRDRQVLVLDEPTAALDPAAEAALFTSIRRLFADRTVLLVSHRFGSCRTADQIFVVHRGRIVEHGTHDELVDAAGRYARLFELQAAWYQSSA